MRTIASQPLPPPASVLTALQKLGQDISFARRRRKLSQQMLAERIGASVTTVRRMEAGNPHVALLTLARTLFVFGELDKLNRMLDSAEDAIGLLLMDEQLPQRVRAPKRTPGSGAM